MREARTSMAVMGMLLVGACGGSTSSQAITLTPTVGTSSVMECLAQEAQKLGYKITLLDRAGSMTAERRDDKPDINHPREYAGGDLITVSRLKKQGDAQPLSVKPTSFVMEWLANGANQKQVETSQAVLGDAKALEERCRL
jgi:hypothetical protein